MKEKNNSDEFAGEPNTCPNCCSQSCKKIGYMVCKDCSIREKHACLNCLYIFSTREADFEK